MRFDATANSIGFLRLLLATLVLFSHTYALGGFGSDPLTTFSRQLSFGGLAVDGFFVLSGFLITRSFARSPQLGDFLWRRFLRIFPAFWVCLIVTAFVFAPIAWLSEHGNVTGVFAAQFDSPLDYVAQNALLSMNQSSIGGLFSSTPMTRLGLVPAVNGSLWTLWDEFECYLGVALFGLAALQLRRRVAILAPLIPLGGMHLWFTLAPDLASAALQRTTRLLDPDMYRLSFQFVVGAALYVFRDRIPATRWAAALAAVVLLVSLAVGGYVPIGELAGAYLWLWLAVGLPRLFRRADAHGDFSYGVYIYAFPVQQLLALYGVHMWGFVPYLGLSGIGTAVLAIASWHLVEKPALAFRRWSPVRALRDAWDRQVALWPWHPRAPGV